MSPKPDVSVERRQQIYAAARACFGRQGYHRTTMDDIVAESGLSKGTLYWYFAGKKELFLALFQETMANFGREWEGILADRHDSPTQRLLATIALFRRELDEMAPSVGILLEAWALTRHDEEVERQAQEFYQPYVDAMKALIEEGVASGEFSVDSAGATALAVMILYDGINLALGTGLITTDWDRLMDAAEVLVLRGLGVQA